MKDLTNRLYALTPRDTVALAILAFDIYLVITIATKII